MSDARKGHIPIIHYLAHLRKNIDMVINNVSSEINLAKNYGLPILANRKRSSQIGQKVRKRFAEES